MGEVLENDDRLRARVSKLMLKFACCVQRIDVHHGQPGTQCAEQSNRVLQNVGHRQGDSRSLPPSRQALQPRGETAAQALSLSVGKCRTQVPVRGMLWESAEGALQHVVDRGEFV